MSNKKKLLIKIKEPAPIRLKKSATIGRFNIYDQHAQFRGDKLYVACAIDNEVWVFNRNSQSWSVLPSSPSGIDRFLDAGLDLMAISTSSNDGIYVFDDNENWTWEGFDFTANELRYLAGWSAGRRSDFGTTTVFSKDQVIQKSGGFFVAQWEVTYSFSAGADIIASQGSSWLYATDPNQGRLYGTTISPADSFGTLESGIQGFNPTTLSSNNNYVASTEDGLVWSNLNEISSIVSYQVGDSPMGFQEYDGRIYVACYDSDEIWREDGEGSFELAARLPPNSGPCELINFDGVLWVLTAKNNSVYVMDSY